MKAISDWVEMLGIIPLPERRRDTQELRILLGALRAGAETVKTAMERLEVNFEEARWRSNGEE